MHRTYSMRSTRAPTASELQNPPPPTSSTKSGRLFGKNPLGENVPLSSCVLPAGKEQDTLVPQQNGENAAAYLSIRDEVSVVQVHEAELRGGFPEYMSNEDVACWVANQPATERSPSPSSFHKRKPLRKIMPRRAVKKTCCCPP
jgi:hypothetical protein